jgi:hypothetical protein
MKMKKFEEGKKYSNEYGAEILVDRRTAKYLVVGLPGGDMKWVYLRNNGEAEHVICDGTFSADNVVEESEPEDFSIKAGDYVKTPRFLRVEIQKVFKSEANARKQGYTEPTHYDNDKYGIAGKHKGTNRMEFAAYEK